MLKHSIIKSVRFTVGLSILCSLFIFSTGMAQQESESVYDNSWALLVGVNTYPHLPPEFRLNYAINDVDALSTLLVEKFGFSQENIIVLRDGEATQKNILDQLSDLSDTRRIGQKDRVLVFFSGHGQTVPLRNSGEMGFLIPYDAKVDLSDVTNPSQYYKSCIGMDELKRRSSAIPAKHVLFLVDACYSGLAASTRSPQQVPITIKARAKLPVRHVITAGLRGEQVVEKPEWGHGAFTYKLLEALDTGGADFNDDSVTTGSELAQYLRGVVPNLTEGQQTPHQGRFEGEGEFLFMSADAQPPGDSESPRIEFIEPPELRGKRRNLQIQLTGDPIKIVGLATDNVGVENVLVDSHKVSLTPAADAETRKGFEIVGAPDDKTVRFEYEVAANDKRPDVEIQAVDTAGNRETLSVRLTPPGKGTLFVKTKPMGAKIYVDGEYHGESPKRVKNLSAGKHNIRLVLGEREYKKVVTIRAGATEKLIPPW